MTGGPGQVLRPITRSGKPAMTPPNKPAKKGRTQRRGRVSQAAVGQDQCKFVGYGEEIIQKEVKPSGRFGRVYLPPSWVGKNVVIIRLN